MKTEGAVGKHVSRGMLTVAFAVLSIFFVLPVHADTLPNIPLFTYTADALPSSADGWDKGYASFESIGAHIENGVLHITDFYTYGGSAIGYSKGWEEMPGYINVAEFDVKLVSNSSIVGILIGTSDGKNNMLYTLFPDRILSSYGDDAADGSRIYLLGETCFFDTTAQFNTYKTVIRNGIAKLYINGNLVLEQRAGSGIYDVHGVQFGSGNSAATGEAYFDEVRAYRQPASVSVQLAVSPRTLNLRSNGQWVSAHLEVPAGYDVNEINQATVTLQNSISADITKTEILDYNNNGIADIMMKFDRAALQNMIGGGDTAEIVINGEFNDGTPFTGRDSIKIVR